MIAMQLCIAADGNSIPIVKRNFYIVNTVVKVSLITGLLNNHLIFCKISLKQNFN